jgi:hypothetical protein
MINNVLYFAKWIAQWPQPGADILAAVGPADHVAPIAAAISFAHFAATSLPEFKSWSQSFR